MDIQIAVDVNGRTPIDEWKGLEATEGLHVMRELIRLRSDEETFARYSFPESAREFRSDRSEAGLFKSPAIALRAMLSCVRELSDVDGVDIDGRVFSFVSAIAAVTAAFRNIQLAGAMFGYDGGRQNRLAAPTPFLIVVDFPERAAYGIELLTA